MTPVKIHQEVQSIVPPPNPSQLSWNDVVPFGGGKGEAAFNSIKLYFSHYLPRHSPYTLLKTNKGNPMQETIRKKRTLHHRAISLRHEKYYAEVAMWNILKNRQFFNYKFRRQHIIGSYIVDFVCLSRKFIIELDGESHEHRKEYDDRRTWYLQKQGYRVYRISNQRFLNGSKTLTNEILIQLHKNFLPQPKRTKPKAASPNPSS